MALIRRLASWPRTVEAAALARQSRIPRSHLLLVDRHGTYAHNDPAAAYPRNAFFENLIRFLDRASGH